MGFVGDGESWWVIDKLDMLGGFGLVILSLFVDFICLSIMRVFVWFMEFCLWCWVEDEGGEFV